MTRALPMTTPEELTELLAASPKEASKRRRLALEIAAKGSQDVTRKMDKLASRSQASAWHEPTSLADIAGVHRAATKKRAATKPRYRTIPHATVAISYRLRKRELYFYGHDVAFYFDACKRGAITEMEFAEYVANVELMG